MTSSFLVNILYIFHSPMFVEQNPVVCCIDVMILICRVPATQFHVGLLFS